MQDMKITVAQLMRIEILEAKSGVCIFEKIWKWSGVSSTEGICKLILTFHQISREIGDTGEVAQVLFESLSSGQPKERLSGGTHKTHKKTASRTLKSQIGSLKSKGETESAQEIRLACDKDNNLIVATFHESSDQVTDVNQFTKAVLNEFGKHYGELIVKMKDTFEILSDENLENSSISRREVMQKFEDFNSTVEKLYSSYKSLPEDHGISH